MTRFLPLALAATLALGAPAAAFGQTTQLERLTQHTLDRYGVEADVTQLTTNQHVRIRAIARSARKGQGRLVVRNALRVVLDRG